MKLEPRLDACWRLLRTAKPRSKRRLKLESEMISIQLKRLKQEIKAGRTAKNG